MLAARPRRPQPRLLGFLLGAPGGNRARVPQRVDSPRATARGTRHREAVALDAVEVEPGKALPEGAREGAGSHECVRRGRHRGGGLGSRSVVKVLRGGRCRGRAPVPRIPRGAPQKEGSHALVASGCRWVRVIVCTRVPAEGDLKPPHIDATRQEMLYLISSRKRRFSGNDAESGPRRASRCGLLCRQLFERNCDRACSSARLSGRFCS